MNQGAANLEDVSYAKFYSNFYLSHCYSIAWDRL